MEAGVEMRGVGGVEREGGMEGRMETESKDSKLLLSLVAMINMTASAANDSHKQLMWWCNLIYCCGHSDCKVDTLFIPISL